MVCWLLLSAVVVQYRAVVDIMPCYAYPLRTNLVHRQAQLKDDMIEGVMIVVNFYFDFELVLYKTKSQFGVLVLSQGGQLGHGTDRGRQKLKKV